MQPLHGSIYQRPNGRYTAVVTLTPSEKGSQRRRSLGTFNTRGEAEAALRTQYRSSEVATDNTAWDGAIGEKGASNTVGQITKEWMAKQHLRCDAGILERQTRKSYEAEVRRYILPYLEATRLEDLTPDLLEEYQLKLHSSGLSDRTVQKAWRTLNRIFKHARLSPNPCQQVDTPRVRERHRTVRPTADEVNAFLQHVESCSDCRAMSTFWRLAATTGMRRGELCGLAWDCVDLDSGLVHVRRSIGLDGGHFVKKPKSATGERSIGLDSETLRRLAELRQDVPMHRTWPLGLDVVLRHPQTGGLVGLNKASAFFKRHWLHAGLRSEVSLHGLRHSHGSALLLRGLPVTQIAARLGHDPHVLLMIYAGELDSGVRQRAMAGAVTSLYSS